MLGRNTFGYARLNISIFMSTVLVLSVLFYQWYVHGQLVEGRRVGEAPAAPTFAQLYPQTLPALSQGFYELVVQDQSGQSHSLGLFTLQGAQKQMVLASGRTVDNGLFALPSGVSTPRSIALYIRADAQETRRVLFAQDDVNGDRAHLAFTLPDARQIAGQFMLATPTDGDATLNEISGLWFGTVASSQSSLRLPSLPAGWVYEGWAIADNRPLTTGRFVNAGWADQAAPFSATSAGPNIPGEDFLRNAPTSVFPGLTFPLDLRGQRVAISVEPDVNGNDPTGASPFGITILEADISRRADARELYDLDRNTVFPEASVILR